MDNVCRKHDGVEYVFYTKDHIVFYAELMSDERPFEAEKSYNFVSSRKGKPYRYHCTGYGKEYYADPSSEQRLHRAYFIGVKNEI